MAGGWLFAALYFTSLQVLPLYLWLHLPRSQTVYRRMAATTAAAALAGWVPTARRLAASGSSGTQAVLAAMGIRSCGLAAACTLPLALTAVLFAGPLAQLAVEGRRGWAARTALPLEVKLRNWAVAPLVEEFVFRACLISFLLASGAAPAASAWLSPLLFGAAHLHHAYDLVRFQRYPLRAALAQLLFQLAYTTLFGWLAAHLFVRSRHLAAAALPHAFCNFMGPPAPPPHGAPYRRGILAAYTAGVLTFFLLLRWLLRPELYCNAPS